jgi:hypothetical protein
MAGEATGGANRAHARVEHDMPGRVRVRVVPEERSPEHLERVRRKLEAHPDVTGVDVNPRTGSVLVLGERTNRLRVALDEALEIVEEEGPENVQEAGLESVLVLVQGLDRWIGRSTGGQLSLRWLVPASFIAVALRQLLRQGVTLGELPWFVLLYYGVDSFLKLYPQHAPRHPNGTAPS